MSEWLAQLLEARTQALSRVIDENNALSVALGKQLGGGIDISRYAHQLVCKACGCIVTFPDNHACGDGS